MMNKLAKPARKQSKVHRSLLLGSFSALGLLAVSTVTAGAKAVNVGTGDTVWGIAQREGLSTTKIEEANPSISRVTNSVDLIFAGQQLQLPTAASLNQSLSQQGLYTVQKGDTLSRIAKHFDVTVAQLKAWNHLNNDLIYVGQQLAVNADSAKLVAPFAPAAPVNTTDETVTTATQAAPVTTVQPADTVSAQPAASQAPVSAAPASAAVNQSAAPVQSAAPAQSQSAATSAAPVASATTSDTTAQTSTSLTAQTGTTSTASASSAAQPTQFSNTAVASQAPQSTSQEVAQQPAGADEDAEATAQSASGAMQTVSAAPVQSASTAPVAQSAATTSDQATQTLNVQTQQATSSANWAQTLDTSFVAVPAQSAAQSSVATTTATSQVASSAAQTSQAPVSQAAQSTATQQSQAQQTSQATSQSTSAASNSSDLQTGSVVSLAVKLANSNIPYVWGGNSLSGMDCSGLVDYVYAHATGKQLPHYTVALESCVNQHPVSQAQAGDLLFWGQHGATYHTAIYIGNNQYVAAPQPGENVQIQSISQYFMPSFAGTVK